MYVNVAVLKETQLHEKRVALVPFIAEKLLKLGAVLQMQSGAGDAVNLPDAAFKGVIFADDIKKLLNDADVLLAVQPPAPAVIDAMKEGAMLLSFICAEKEPALVKRLLEKKITCFAMERIPRISRAQSMDALSSQSALAGYYAVRSWQGQGRYRVTAFVVDQHGFRATGARRRGITRGAKFYNDKAR